MGGYKVTVVDQQPHRLEYPMFTDPDGIIDIFTGTDLPFNHAPWLWNHTDQFFVMGTVHEATDINLGVPSYAGLEKVSDLVSAKDDLTDEVLSLDEKICPACRKQGQDFADSLGWTMRQATPEDFLSEVQERMGNNEKFAVSWYVPSYIQASASGVMNFKGDVEPWSRHNIGKVVARFDSADKLTADARNFLSSAFIGNDAIQEMDVAVHGGADPKSAADAWIEE